MRKAVVVAGFAALVLASSSASAQVPRTWVSGTGDDVNPCSRDAPCRTFAGAISKTAVGGEIDALDPGGFGSVTITKSITIDGGGGQVASVTASGVDGIVVAVGPSDVVTLRHLRLNGNLGPGSVGAGINGIRFLSGKVLNVESVYISGFNNVGIDIELGASGYANIVNTVIENIGTGKGDGIYAVTTSGLARVHVRHTRVFAAAGSGIEAGSGATIAFDEGELTSGANGATARPGGAIVVSNSTIMFNSTGYNLAGGLISTVSNSNRVLNNGTNGVATTVNGN